MEPSTSLAVAKAVIESAEKSGTALSDLSTAVRMIEDHDLRRKLLLNIGELMVRLYEDIMKPVIEEYPTLDPDKKG